jgi:hypothetical protein
MAPTIKPNYKSTFHKDKTISYWNVYHQVWERTSAYALTNYHDVFASLSFKDREKINKIVFPN